MAQPIGDDRFPRVAFTHWPSAIWTAGANYLRNLFVALRDAELSPRPESVLLVAKGADPASYQDLKPLTDRVIPRPDPLPRPGFWQRQGHRIRMRMGMWQEPEDPLGPYLRQNHVDCVFANGEFGPAFGVPLMTWIPDFQHLWLPEMFSKEEIELRNERFMAIARHSTRIVLSSRSAFADLERFSPAAVAKARVLPFVAHVPAEVFQAAPRTVCEQYDLPERFIYLPNQFWRHKNHELVLQALALLKAKAPAIKIVCTGNTNDYRNPLFFGELLCKVSTLGLREQFIVLGTVPHEHIFQLMRQALVVLQPSRFEGWSTTVEEVKSIGKAVLLSDIPVHREQNPPQAMFFDPGDSDQLAECMLRAYNERSPGPDDDLETQARARLTERSKHFAQSFVTISRETIEIFL